MIYEKKAFFSDNIGDIQKAIIRINTEMFINIETYNNDNKKTGYMGLFIHPNKRIFLDTIYCYDEFRSRGIATWISKLADYLLKDYADYIIRGVYEPYEPSQLSADRQSNIISEQGNLNLRANNFYIRCGYQIISLKDFLENSSQYPILNQNNDFQLGEKLAKHIVVKQNNRKENYHFFEDGGIIYSDNFYLEKQCNGIPKP